MLNEQREYLRYLQLEKPTIQGEVALTVDENTELQTTLYNNEDKIASTL